jgi:hypothetical protein
MAEREAGGKGGWLKTIFGGLFGLLSGAALMYLSPLVDRVVKPAKPLANFAVEVQGTQATFENRSTGGHEGWWDFGDGSPLQPFSPEQQSVPHPYPRPGSYTAKLNVRSLFGEESERGVAVQIDAPAAGPPEVTLLQVVNTRPDSYAPATFRLVGKVKNADVCVWSTGPGQPLQVQPRPPEDQEQYVTFPQPGTYTIRLAAAQGTQVVEKNQTVKVDAPRAGVAMAVLNVTRETVRTEVVQDRLHPQIAFPGNVSAGAYDFNVQVPVRAGCRIRSAALAPWCLKSPAVQNARAAASPDGTKVILTGRLLRQGGGLLKKGAAPTWVACVDVALERPGAPAVQRPESMAAILNLSMPTMLAIPQPQGVQVLRQSLSLDVTDGSRPTMQRLTVPGTATVVLQNRPWQMTATQQGNQVRVEVRPLPTAGALTGN